MASTLLPRVEVGPETPDATLTVVWMHGLGADGHDFEPIVPILNTPKVRYVFPHAPARPVTINGGMTMPSWYDIMSLEDLDGRESEADIVRSSRQIRELVEHERAAGMPSERIVVAGFSQGGAMALHVGTRWEEPLAGILVLSAYLLVPDRFDAEAVEAQRKTPIFFGHGSFDPVVPVDRGRAAYDRLRQWTEGEVQWHDYPMGHQVCPPQLEDIGAWMRAREG